MTGYPGYLGNFTYPHKFIVLLSHINLSVNIVHRYSVQRTQMTPRSRCRFGRVWGEVLRESSRVTVEGARLRLLV